MYVDIYLINIERNNCQRERLIFGFLLLISPTYIYTTFLRTFTFLHEVQDQELSILKEKPKTERT